MSVTRRIAFGASAHWVSRGISIVLGLVLLPVLFRNLSKSELGVWLLLGQTWATMGFLDFGFGTTLTRMIAFGKGKSGSSPNAVLSAESKAEIADLLATGKRVFLGIAIVSSGGAFAVGWYYLTTIDAPGVEWSTITWTWGILCCSYAATTLAAPWACLLQGTGYVGWDVLIASLVQILTLLGQVVAASLGGSIVSLAVLAVAGALLQRIIYLNAARKKHPELFALRGKWRPDVVRQMAPLSFKAWLTTLGGVLVIGSDQFLVTSLEGTENLASYRAAWILIHNLTIVALTFSSVSPVFISHYWQEGNIGQVHRILERNLRFGWLVMLLSAAVLGLAGQTLFDLWLGAGNFVGYAVLAAFLFTEALETQSYSISQMSRATGDEGFAVSSMLGGVTKITLSILLAPKFGLFGIAMGTLIALALTNHWYMPWRGLNRMAYPKLRFILRVILPPAGVAAAALICLAGIGRLCHNLEPLSQMVVLVGSAAVFFGGGVWTLVLASSERARLLAIVKSLLPIKANA